MDDMNDHTSQVVASIQILQSSNVGGKNKATAFTCRERSMMSSLDDLIMAMASGSDFLVTFPYAHTRERLQSWRTQVSRFWL